MSLLRSAAREALVLTAIVVGATVIVAWMLLEPTKRIVE